MGMSPVTAPFAAQVMVVRKEDVQARRRKGRVRTTLTVSPAAAAAAVGSGVSNSTAVWWQWVCLQLLPDVK